VKVAVIGASPNPERYSNKAIRMLREYDHEVVPVNPGQQEIEGLAVVPELSQLAPGSIDTVTMYVQASRSDSLLDALVALRPRRVIFNPGAENPTLAANLEKAGIQTVENCTLVMLRVGIF
jgi:uncharacterized protein